MESYLNLVFQRSFILSELEHWQIEKELAPSCNTDNFEKTFFGKYVFWYSKQLKIIRVDDKYNSLCIFGIFVDPFNEQFEKKDIAENLLSALRYSKRKLNEEIAKLTGNFCVIFRSGNSYSIQPDAAATKSVYWAEGGSGELTVSSHSQIVASLAKKNINNAILELRVDELYKAMPSPFLPGLTTPFNGVNPLIANHEFNLNERVQDRFYPSSPLPEITISEAIDKLVFIFNRQAQLLERLDRPILVAATGGKDSRVSMASFSSCKNTDFFTFHFESNSHLSDDVAIAKKVVSKIGGNLNVFNLEKYFDLDFKKYFEKHSPLGIWSAAALCYIKNFDQDAIHVRSTVSEIGRCFYGLSSGAKKVSGESLAGTYSGNGLAARSDIIQIFNDYIEKTQFYPDKFVGRDSNDMFYWEHRNSKWQNVLCQEAEMATDVFIPFNNRNALELFLTAEPSERHRARIHKELIKQLAPELETIEFC